VKSVAQSLIVLCFFHFPHPVGYKCKHNFVCIGPETSEAYFEDFCEKSN